MAARTAQRAHRQARRSGFTLIEVVVAIFIISVTLMALGPLMMGVSRGNTYGQYMTLASGRLQEKVEELKNKTYAQVVNGTETLTRPAMTRQVTVVSEVVPNALKEVDVKVTWTERGVARHVALRTFIANRALQ